MATMIAEELEIEDFDEKNLKCCCPFHEEDTPSFIWNEKALSFRCFGACGRSYDIIDIYMHKGLTYIEACEKLFKEAEVQYSFGEKGVKSRGQYRYPSHEDKTDKSRVYEYLKKRRISKETADYLDIGEDKNGNVVFHYYDLSDVLSVVKYRPSHKLAKGESKNFYQQGTDVAPILYNINRINVGQPLAIFSGELDCAAAIEAGWKNSVSICGGDQNFKWVEECWDWLEQFKEILICPDNDESGVKYCKNIVPRLGTWRTKIIDVPEFATKPGGTRKHIKDFNEYLYNTSKEEALRIILNPKDTPVPSLIDFSDVEEMDTSDLDGVTLGIDEIDKEFGKFFFGSFNIISGLPGSGKTSLISSLICSAMEQDYNSWLFSRELPTWMSKSWIVQYLAGNRHLSKFEGKKGSIYYKVNNSAYKAINAFYKNRLYLYRDDYSNEIECVKNSMVDAARKYGCKVFVIDNLMMLDLGGNDDNKLEKQKEIINWLIQFSTKFQVLTFLVCHPNKTQSYTEGIGMFQISGASEIINLAHRAIGLRRIPLKEKEGIKNQRGDGWFKEPTNFDVMINTIKDRFTGKNFEVGIYYDVPSRRFFTSYEEYDYKYKWDKTEYTERIPEPKQLVDGEREVFG